MSLDERIKAFGKVELNELLDADESGTHRKSSTWPFLVEYYASSKFEIHLHLRFHRVPQHGIDSSHFCAIFQSTSGKCEPLDLAMSKSFDGKITVVNGCMGYVEQPVLVVVRDFMKKPKRMEVWRPIRSVVRLQSLDACLYPIGESFDLSEAATGDGLATLVNLRVTAGVQKDGELVSRRRIPTVLHNRSPDDVVKARPNIIDTVSNQETPFEWQWLIDPNSNHPILGVHIEIEDGIVGVIIEELLDFPLESLEMHLCSPKLEKGRTWETPWFHHVLPSRHNHTTLQRNE